MKKIILTLALMAAAATSAFAQLSLGVGISSATSIDKVDTKDIGNLPLSGYYAGLDYDFRLGLIGITPGVYVSYNQGEGSVADLTGIKIPSLLGDLTKAKKTELYLNIPLMLNIGIDLSIARVFVFAGPTVNLGILSEVQSQVDAVKEDGKLNLYDKDSGYGRFDILMGGGVGVDLLKKVRATVGYNYGLVDRFESDSATKHRTELRAGVAWLF